MKSISFRAMVWLTVWGVSVLLTFAFGYISGLSTALP